jgi:predicted transcriptional regulator
MKIGKSTIRGFRMTLKILYTSIKTTIYIVIIYFVVKHGYLQKTLKIVGEIPNHVIERTIQRNKRNEAEKVFLNSNTKFVDLFNSPKSSPLVSFTIPKESKIQVELPKISSVMKPPIKRGFKILQNKFQNWRKTRSMDQRGKSDPVDLIDVDLVTDIVKQSSEKVNKDAEKITLEDILEEYKIIH